MMQRRPVLLVSSMAICLAFRLEGQFAPGGRQIWALELAGLAPGSMPAGLQIISGGGVVVAMKDGVAMLKAAAVTEFEVSLPEKLPDQFTLQFEIIPKRCCNPDDLFFAGTSSKGQGGNSAEFGWHPAWELLLYVVHGTLHLCGYDDRTPAQRRQMRLRERTILRDWGMTISYAGGRARPRPADD